MDASHSPPLLPHHQLRAYGTAVEFLRAVRDAALRDRELRTQENSVESHWVREEAGYARDKGILCPVFLDETPPPFGFSLLQGAQLSAEPDAEGNLAKNVLALVAPALQPPERSLHGEPGALGATHGRVLAIACVLTLTLAGTAWKVHAGRQVATAAPPPPQPVPSQPMPLEQTSRQPSASTAKSAISGYRALLEQLGLPADPPPRARARSPTFEPDPPIEVW
jgi:hypothetical protein